MELRQPVKQPISDDERTRRQAAVDASRTSLRLEGFVLDQDIELLFEHYVQGILTDSQLTTAINSAVGLS